jgi:hypothetical protein
MGLDTVHAFILGSPVYMVANNPTYKKLTLGEAIPIHRLHFLLLCSRNNFDNQYFQECNTVKVGVCNLYIPQYCGLPKRLQ